MRCILPEYVLSLFAYLASIWYVWTRRRRSEQPWSGSVSPVPSPNERRAAVTTGDVHWHGRSVEVGKIERSATPNTARTNAEKEDEGEKGNPLEDRTRDGTRESG